METSPPPPQKRPDMEPKRTYSLGPSEASQNAPLGAGPPFFFL
jgi:hypothetical protein